MKTEQEIKNTIRTYRDAITVKCAEVEAARIEIQSVGEKIKLLEWILNAD